MLFVLLGGIGLPSAAVYLQTWLMTPTRRTLVSLAGPTANLTLSALMRIRLCFDPARTALWARVVLLSFLQIVAVVLNLLPTASLNSYDA